MSLVLRKLCLLFTLSKKLGMMCFVFRVWSVLPFCQVNLPLSFGCSEVKSSRQDLPTQVAIPASYNSFFSFPLLGGFNLSPEKCRSASENRGRSYWVHSSPYASLGWRANFPPQCLSSPLYSQYITKTYGCSCKEVWDMGYWGLFSRLDADYS